MVARGSMSAAASSSRAELPPQQPERDLWTSKEGLGLTWDDVYNQEEPHGHKRSLRRICSDSSLTSLSSRKEGGRLTPATSSCGSQYHTRKDPNLKQERWQNGCYMKYCTAACWKPACPYLHNLDELEIAEFVAWNKTENHVLFGSERSDSSVNSLGVRGRGGKGEGAISSRSHIDVAYLSGNSGAEDFGPGEGEDGYDGRDGGHQDDGDPNDSNKGGPGHQELLRELLERFKGMDEETLMSHLPVDEQGQPTTVGSLLHESGRCKPCLYRDASEVCADGLLCRFCHLSHKARQRRRTKLRPCKGKRDRYRKLVSRIADTIKADPFAWSAEAMEVPPSIAANTALKKKLTSRMLLLADGLRSGGVGSARPEEREDDLLLGGGESRPASSIDGYRPPAEPEKQVLSL